MPDFPQRLGHSLWNILQHVSVILPAGTLFGAAMALSLPRHNHLSAVIVIIMSVSGAVSGLLYRHTLRQVHLSRVALVVAFAVIAPRLLRLFRPMKSPSFVDEAISCIQDYTVSMAVIISAVAMGMLSAILRTQQTNDIATEETNSMAPSVRSHLGTSESSLPSPSDMTSNNDLLFGHMEGPELQPLDSTASEAEALALPPDSRRDPAWILDIVGWLKTAGQADSGKKNETTIQPQV